MSTETIDVPEDLRGHIIGKKGRTIKEIIRNSNAEVKHIETGFSVTGTEDEIQMAKGMIESIMKEQESYRLKAQNQEKMSKTTQNTISKEIQVPLYMKRFLFHYNKVRGGRTFREIERKTNTKIENTGSKKDNLCLIGSQEENIQAAENRIKELEILISERLLPVELPDPSIIPFVIGKGGETVKKIQEETQTCIEVKEPYFYIYGQTEQQQHKAKLKIKEIASNRIKIRKIEESYQTMSFVDDSFVNDDSDEFSLSPVENPPGSRWFGSHHKIVGAAKVDGVSFKEGNMQVKEIEGMEDLVENVHQKLRQLQELEDRDSYKIDLVCHYGNVYVKNVDEAEEGATYSAQELKKYLRGTWETVFDGGLRELNVDKLKEEYEKDAVPPYIRYDFSVLSPSCRRFIMKANLRRNENGEFEFSSLDPEVPQEDPYELVPPTIRHMKIHVIILNTDIDCCLNIQTKLRKDTHTHKNTTDDDDELKVLKEFLDDRLLKLKNGAVDLIKPNEFPEGYHLNYWRKSERKIFKDDYGFTITTTKEEMENVDGFELGKNVVFKKTGESPISVLGELTNQDSPDNDVGNSLSINLEKDYLKSCMTEAVGHEKSQGSGSYNTVKSTARSTSNQRSNLRYLVRLRYVTADDLLQSEIKLTNNVQVHLNNSDKKLSIPKCEGDQTTETDGDELFKQKEQTRKYVEKVLRFAREVQNFFSAQDPDE